MWARQVLIALDQLLTALVGGWADETLSSYAYRLHRDGKPWGRVWLPVIDWFFWTAFRQANHCLAAYIEERERRQFPPELR
jgi:hypothetical protein